MEKLPELEKLLINLSSDHEPALEQLFHYYYPRLHRFSKAFLKLDDGIDDILQEVFIKIWENRKKIRSKETFNAYIFTISRNLLLNELRSRLQDQKAREVLLKKSVAEEFMLYKDSDFIELKERVEEAMAHLPESHRLYFKMSREEGLSNRSIAEKMGVSEKTVEYHISQAINIIRQKLQDLGMISLLYLCLFL